MIGDRDDVETGCLRVADQPRSACLSRPSTTSGCAGRSSCRFSDPRRRRPRLPHCRGAGQRRSHVAPGLVGVEPEQHGVGDGDARRALLGGHAVQQDGLALGAQSADGVCGVAQDEGEVRRCRPGPRSPCRRDSTTSVAPSKQACLPADPAQRDDRVGAVAARAVGAEQDAGVVGVGYGDVGQRARRTGRRRRPASPCGRACRRGPSRVASETRSRPSRPGQPCTARRQRHGTALAPHRAPSSPPAMAATVSVSLPIRTAACSASWRWRQAKSPCRASSGTGGGDRRERGLECGDGEPVGREPGRRSRSTASSSQDAHWSRRSAGSRSRPARDVDAALEDRDPDGLAPQHARVAGERVGVGQPRRRAGRPVRSLAGRRGGPARRARCASVRRCRPSAGG